MIPTGTAKKKKITPTMQIIWIRSHLLGNRLQTCACPCQAGHRCRQGEFVPHNCLNLARGENQCARENFPTSLIFCQDAGL